MSLEEAVAAFLLGESGERGKEVPRRASFRRPAGDLRFFTGSPRSCNRRRGFSGNAPG